MPPAQPALGLDEVEEEHPGELQKGQRLPVLGRNRPAEVGGHAVEHALERLEEPTTQSLSGDCLRGSRRVGRGALSGNGAQALERDDVHRIGTVELDGEGGQAVEGDRQRQPAPSRIEAEHAREPTPRGQAPRQAAGLGVPTVRAHAVPGELPVAADHDGSRCTMAPRARVGHRLPQRLVPQGSEPRWQVADGADSIEAPVGVHGGSGGRAPSLPFRLGLCGSPRPQRVADLRRLAAATTILRHPTALA